MTNHELSWEVVPMQTSFGVKDRHRATCSCGEVIEAQAPNSNGTPSKHSKRRAFYHVLVEEGRDAAADAPMELVGKVIKTRVTNEIWIVSYLGDHPGELASRFTTINDYRAMFPWTTLIKNSRGWKTGGHGAYQYREQAYAAALFWLEDQRNEGHDIEVGMSIDVDTIDVPLGSVERYLQNLINEARQGTTPKQLVATQERIREARSMLELLETAQQVVEMKLLGLEDETLKAALEPDSNEPDSNEPDSNYTSYSYTPSN